ncbi:IS66 family insertion sequence element accessory protein TnpB [Vibrio coralliilyticus]|uniref:IS66 family insertion sequence element accessory protein TnpB n=1 Tax=Vibrio coralliilyticus TaxID=190893 RepID=UPI0017AC13F9|nr:IS66 family insertion sequence element accessory protein TnpB [Vibrio coralliilyticus]
MPLGSGALFLFTNKQRDKIKVLYWDKTGFALWYKCLEKAKYKWPSKEKNEVFRPTHLSLIDCFLASRLSAINPFE